MVLENNKKSVQHKHLINESCIKIYEVKVDITKNVYNPLNMISNNVAIYARFRQGSRATTTPIVVT